MRLFIALLLNDELLDALTDFQDDLRAQGVRGNFTVRENLHVTLAFLGEYDDPEKVLRAMEQVTCGPLRLKLDGVGRFGDLFWAGLAENPELSACVKRLRHALAAQDIPFDKKRFLPHITLVRKVSATAGNRIPVDETPRGEMVADGVSLMRSERGRHGMIYSEIGFVHFSD